MLWFSSMTIENHQFLLKDISHWIQDLIHKFFLKNLFERKSRELHQMVTKMFITTTKYFSWSLYSWSMYGYIHDVYTKPYQVWGGPWFLSSLHPNWFQGKILWIVYGSTWVYLWGVQERIILREEWRMFDTMRERILLYLFCINSWWHENHFIIRRTKCLWIFRREISWMAGCDRRRWIDRAFLWSFYFIRFRNLTYFGLWFFSLFFQRKIIKLSTKVIFKPKIQQIIFLKLDVGWNDVSYVTTDFN